MKNIIKKGFTLLEILVVISIIGILTGLAIFSFEPAQKRARDTQRKSDLKQYQTSLESYANNNSGLYPIHTTSVTISTNNLCDVDELDISGSCPEDPKTGFDIYGYHYVSDTAASEFILWAKLETDDYWVVCSSGKSDVWATTPALPCPL